MGPKCPTCGKTEVPLGSRLVNGEWEHMCPCKTIYNEHGKKVVYSKDGRKVID